MKYDENLIGGERWLILNDAKTDDPAYVWVVNVEERQKKSGDGTLPVLVCHDENKTNFACSAFPRQMEHLIREWGTDSDNWIGKRVALERKGKQLILRPAEEQPKEEKIAE